jgi:phosphate-selective porin OprO/OprP
MKLSRGSVCLTTVAVLAFATEARSQSAPLDAPPQAGVLPTTDATHPQEAQRANGTADSGAASGSSLELTGAFGRGYTLRTRDERFSLTLRARIQVRGTLDLSMAQLAMNPVGADALRAEFNLRRARIVLSGNAYTRALQYYIQLGVSPQDMESDLLIPLRDAYLTYTPHAYFAIRAGQMKVPFSRQRVISSGSQQFVDRAGTNAELNLDRDIGVQFRSDDLLGHRLGYALGVFGGGGRNRPSLDAGLLYVARLQVQPLGHFEDMDVEGDHKRTGPRLSIGVAGAFNQRTNRAQSTLGATYQLRRFDYAHATADLMFKWAGFSLQSEAIWRLADSPGASGIVGATARTEYTRSAVGYMVQASYQTASHLEFGARWSHVIPIALDRAAWGAEALAAGVLSRDPNFHESHELGGVFSYYVLGHSVKLQLDYFYLFREQLEAGNHQLRLQAQLML